MRHTHTAHIRFQCRVLMFVELPQNQGIKSLSNRIKKEIIFPYIQFRYGFN